MPFLPLSHSLYSPPRGAMRQTKEKVMKQRVKCRGPGIIPRQGTLALAFCLTVVPTGERGACPGHGHTATRPSPLCRPRGLVLQDTCPSQILHLLLPHAWLGNSPSKIHPQLPGAVISAFTLSGKKKTPMQWEFPGHPVVDSTLPEKGVWVRSLVREIRSCMSQGMTKQTDHKTK